MSFKNLMSYDKPIEVRTKARITYFKVLLIISIFLSAISFFVQFNNISIGSNSDYVNGVFTSLPITLFLMSILMIIKNKRLLNNSEKLKKIERYENDERNRYISLKTYAYTCFISIIGCFLASTIFTFFNSVISYTLSIIASSMLILYLIIRRILQKKL